MKKEIVEASEIIIEKIKKAIVERTKEGDVVIIAGIGNTIGYRARIRNHGHSCFLCEIVIRSQFHTTYEPEA
jgi:Uncharacterized protein conserved in archaea